MTTAYLNDRFLPLEEAKISVLDRGFLFADSIYEVIPVFNHNIFQLEPHLKRLQRSLDAINLPYIVNIAEWKERLTDLVNYNVEPFQSIYIQITRGAAPTRSHGYDNNLTPTVFAMSTPSKENTYEDLAVGRKAITHEDPRWQWSHIKATALLANIMMAQLAHQSNAVETILYRDNRAVEASSSNVFIVKQGVVITPPLHETMLAGITRELILALLKKHHVPYEEKNISLEELRNADEIWVSGSTKDILPITTLDEQPVGDGNIGPMWKNLIKLYLACKKTSYA